MLHILTELFYAILATVWDVLPIVIVIFGKKFLAVSCWYCWG